MLHHRFPQPFQFHCTRNISLESWNRTMKMKMKMKRKRMRMKMM